MSSNVGLTTPRGSGTSGYVQKNRSLLKPRDKVAPYPKDWDQAKHRQRQPDQEILEHESRREIEVKVFELRDKLEDEGYVNLVVFYGVQVGLHSIDLTRTKSTIAAPPSARNSKTSAKQARALAQVRGA